MCSLFVDCMLLLDTLWLSSCCTSSPNVRNAQWSSSSEDSSPPTAFSTPCLHLAAQKPADNADSMLLPTLAAGSCQRSLQNQELPDVDKDCLRWDGLTC